MVIGPAFKGSKVLVKSTDEGERDLTPKRPINQNLVGSFFEHLLLSSIWSFFIHYFFGFGIADETIK
jgi:hypothetical protein